METLNLPRAGHLLNSRAGMGYTPLHFSPSAAVPIPIPASAVYPPPHSLRSLAEYAGIKIDFSKNVSPNANGVHGTPMTRQERRDLLLSQMARHEDKFSRQFGPQFMQPEYIEQTKHINLQRLAPNMTATAAAAAREAAAIEAAAAASAAAAAAAFGSAERSAHSIATHTAGARESIASSKMPRFVVDNQETIAAKCKHGFGRLPRVATVDLPAAPETDADITHVTVSASTYVSPPLTKAARAAKQEREAAEKKEREKSPSTSSSSSGRSTRSTRSPKSARSSVSRSGPGSPNKVTKKRHTRASSSSSASSASASSLDAITSYIANMPESKRTPASLQNSGRADRCKPRHVSFNVNANGTQGFTIRGNGTEQSYEICGEALIFAAVGKEKEKQKQLENEKLAGANDEERRWASLIYGHGSRAGKRGHSVGLESQDTIESLPSLSEVAELQAASSHRASLDLPPIRSASAVAPLPSALATMQPTRGQAALSFSSSLSPTLGKMADNQMSEEDALIEEHIRGLEAAIRAGGAKYKLVETGSSSFSGSLHGGVSERKSVVMIPPETAATVGSLLGVILREQYCRLREAAEAQQEEQEKTEVAVAVTGVSGDQKGKGVSRERERAGATSLPSISEVFGRQTPPQYYQAQYPQPQYQYQYQYQYQR